jgi:WD40 repeat protein
MVVTTRSGYNHTLRSSVDPNLLGASAVDGTPDTPGEGVCRDLGAELRRQRIQRGFSLGRLAKEAHYTKGYLSRIETGDKPLTPDVARVCDEVLGTGGVLAALLATTESVDLSVCPYRGLAAFAPEQSRWFFGRKQAIDKLVSQLGQRLAGGGPLAVVAASGAGKSSLLAAGLIPALAGGALPGSASWSIVACTPTAEPLAALAKGLAEVTGTDPAAVAESLADPALFVAYLRATIAGESPEMPDSPKAVLIVDQFEEIFTECRNEDERHRFIAALCAASSGDDPAALTILGLRADFYGQCLAYQPLLTALEEGHLSLGAMSPDQLREVIISPAKKEGLKLEAGLVELLLAELGVAEDRLGDQASYDPGVLPLLSHALFATWQQRRGRTLTVAGYRLAGGISEAISTTAERVYSRLTPAEQRIAEQIMTCLVHVGEHNEETRRRLPRDRLIRQLPTLSGTAETVLETFGRERLLTFDTDSVDIAHEALLRAWPRLYRWITTDRVGLRIHQQLSETADSWEQSDRDPSALYRGSRLTLARDWATGLGRADQLSVSAAAFLTASTAQEKRDYQVQRRKSQIVAVLVTLAVVASAIASYQYVVQRNQSRLAIANELAARSNTLTSRQPIFSMSLAVEAFHQAPTTDTRSALLSAQAQYFAGQLTGHTGAVYSAAFSPHGNILATAGADGTMRLWDVASHQPIAVFHSPTSVFSVAFSTNGRTLATSGADTLVRLWDVASHQPIATLSGHTRWVDSVAFSPDGNILATASQDKMARLWDVASHRPIATLSGHTGFVRDVAFSPDGNTLATASQDGTARLWDVASHRPIATLSGYTGPVNSVAFSPDGRTLATGGTDGTARLWDVASHQPITIFSGYTDYIYSVAFSPDGQTLAAGGADDTIRLWDVTSHRLLVTLTGHAVAVHNVTFSSDGQTIASTSEDATTKLWNIGGTILWPRPAMKASGAVFSADGRTLAIANTDLRTNLISLWDTHSHRLLATLASQDGRLHQIVFNPDKRTIATANDNHTATLWDLVNHQAIATLSGHTGSVNSAVFSPDGGVLATASEDGTVRLWDVASHQTIATLNGHNGAIRSVAYNLKGNALATGNQDGTVRLWDVASHQLIATLSGHTGPVNSVAFNLDGRTLATGGADNTVRLWDVASHQLAATLSGHTAAINDVAFSPDNHLATASEDTTVRLWNLNKDQVTNNICHITGSLSPTKWEQLIPELPYRNTCP